jgi:hypothetical protein
MTVFTGYRKTGTGMIGIVCVGVFILMAGIAVGGQARVLSILMAIGAGYLLMGTGQRKICILMIKCSGRPGNIAVTLPAVMIELTLHMTGIGNSQIIILMAGIAIGGKSRILSILMATATGYLLMGTAQGETCICMIESCRRPGDITMTLTAVMIELILHMVRISNSLVIALVAGVAVNWCPGKLSVNMTVTANDRQVCPA